MRPQASVVCTGPGPVAKDSLKGTAALVEDMSLRHVGGDTRNWQVGTHRGHVEHIPSRAASGKAWDFGDSPREECGDLQRGTVLWLTHRVSFATPLDRLRRPWDRLGGLGSGQGRSYFAEGGSWRGSPRAGSAPGQ
jgi:hypothetical protein